MSLPHAETRIVPAGEYRRVRWKNGLGWTREIACAPDGDAWTWRLSIAEIGQDAAFSPFPGVDRELVLLSGNGLRLRFGDGATRELPAPHAHARFAGEAEVAGELVDGPVTGFNLMWRRAAIDARSWHRPLVGTMVVVVDPGATWAVHLLAGRASIDAGAPGTQLEAGDTALLRAGGARSRGVLDGAGEALLVRLTASPAGVAPR